MNRIISLSALCVLSISPVLADHAHKNHFPIAPYVFGHLQGGGEDLGSNPHLNIGSGAALGVGLAFKAPTLPIQLNAQVMRIYNLEERLDLYGDPIHENELSYTQIDALALVQVAPHVKVGGGGVWVRNADYERRTHSGTALRQTFADTKGWTAQIDYDLLHSFNGPTLSLRYTDLKLKDENSGRRYSANSVGVSASWKFGGF